MVASRLRAQRPTRTRLGPSAPAYGFILAATITKGRITAIETRLAELAPGMLLVMTHRNAPKQPESGPPRLPPGGPNRFTRERPFLGDDRVRFWGEPVSLIVAGTFEAARYAAALVRVEYAVEPQLSDPQANLDKAHKPEGVAAFGRAATDTAMGDFEAAFTSAPVTLDATYAMSYQVHSAMEPHAATAEWEGSRLPLHTSTQTLVDTCAAVAATPRMPVS